MNLIARMFALAVAASLFLALIAAAQGDDGRMLETSGRQPLETGVVWRASVIEEQMPGKREGEAVGNVGLPANTNRRKLVIEIMPKDSDVPVRREEVPVPSETIEGDACTVSRVEGFAAKGDALAFTVVREFACGAGSSVSVSYKLQIGRAQTRIVGLTYASASRDAVWAAEVEYLEGRLSVRDQSPDADPDVPQKILKISKEPPALTPQSLMQCLPPLQGPEVMRCRQP